MFMLISREPIKVTHPQKLTNQSMVNSALVIEMVTILLVKARKTLVIWWSEERSNRKKKWKKDMGSENFISTRFSYISKLSRGAKEQESWSCLEQISAGTKLILNLLQKCCMRTSFW